MSGQCSIAPRKLQKCVGGFGTGTKHRNKSTKHGLGMHVMLCTWKIVLEFERL